MIRWWLWSDNFKNVDEQPYFNMIFSTQECRGWIFLWIWWIFRRGRWAFVLLGKLFVENGISKKGASILLQKENLILLLEWQDNEEGHEWNKSWQQIANFEDVDGDVQFGYMFFLQEPRSHKELFYKYVTIWQFDEMLR